MITRIREVAAHRDELILEQRNKAAETAAVEASSEQPMQALPSAEQVGAR